jgi:hypothetical protein
MPDAAEATIGVRVGKVGNPVRAHALRVRERLPAIR